jgi:fumarate reductase flavoprotein subunit
MGGEGYDAGMIGTGAWRLPRRWHETTDVLLIGAGFSGLAAAAAAASVGSAVIVLDKMTRYGGNSAINLGDYAAWDDMRYRRAALGLGEDSAEQHAAEALEASQHYGDPALVATMAGGAPSTLDWMVAEGGLRLREALHRQGSGAFRMHLADSGRDYVEALRAIALKHGAELRTGAKLSRIWRDGATAPLSAHRISWLMEISRFRLRPEGPESTHC